MTERNRQLSYSGFKEFEDMTQNLAPKHARNLSRSTTQGVAGEIAKRMKRAAPKDEGVLRKAIKAKRRRMQGNTAISDVRIEHGKGAKHDAWHWHFVEFGTQDKPEQPYIRPTVSEVEPEMPDIFRRQFAKKLEQTLNRIARAKSRG